MLGEATGRVLPPCYPPPPSGLKFTPDVQTLYDRFEGYCLGKEPLASMAVIRRVAEKAHTPDSDLPEISLSDLPPV